MPSLIDGPASLRSLLRPVTDENNRRATKQQKQQQHHGASGGGVVGLLKMFKLVPMLATGCKMAAMLGGRHNKYSIPRPPALLADHLPAVTLFGRRRGRLSLAIHEDTRAAPAFLIELPMLAPALHREMATGTLKLALESDTRSARRRLLEEYVWAVYCNGREAGYAIRRKAADASDDETHVLRMLRGVSMGAGVLPPPPGSGERGLGLSGGAATAATPSNGPDGELTYMRARVERVVGSKDSEAFYMINPDDAGAKGGHGAAAELSIFLVRKK